MDSQQPMQDTMAPAPSMTNMSTGYAGFWRRVLAFIIDSIIVGISFQIIENLFGGSARIQPAGTITTLGTFFSILSIVTSWLYFSLMESSTWQATLGKRIIGIKVTDLNGNRVSFARATGRYFAKIISGVILGIGYLMAAFTAKKQALHDMIASTLVVKSK